MRNVLLVFGLLLASYGPVSAQNVERVLVPIYEPFPIPGAFGSEWISDFRILNTGDTPVVIQDFGPGCNFDPCPELQIPPRTTISGGFVRRKVFGGWNPAAVLRIDDPGADDLVFQLRVRDISRAFEGWGTWVPVVRESSIVPGPVHLLNVPVEDGYRLMLRVYSLEEPVRVLVRIFGTEDSPVALPQQPDPLIAQFFFDLLRGGSSEPAYMQSAEVGEMARGKGFRLVRLEIAPEGDVPIWAMVSVTNNTTQQVTGVYPNK